MTTNNEIQVFQSEAFRAGWRAAAAGVGPGAQRYVLPGAPGTSWHSAEDADAFIASLDDVETDTGGAGAPPRNRPPVVAAAPAAPPGGRGPKRKPFWWEMH